MDWRVALRALMVSAVVSGIAGCGMGHQATSGSTGLDSALGNIKGKVIGGRQPISGAKVFVLAASTQAFGGVGISSSSSNLASSLLTAYSSGSYPTAEDNSSGATNGFYYVTSDANGNFGLSGEYSCTAGQQVYLYTSGGDTGGGTPNAAATLMAVLGTCPSSGNFAAQIPSLVVNELSTVAAAYALAGFATDPLHIGDDESVTSNTTASLAKTGMTNAVATAALLTNITTASGTALSTTPSGNGAVPASTVNTLADILAACVNTTGAGSQTCSTLFASATADGTSTGTAATDTADAAINIAHFPAYNVGTLYGLVPATAVPYQPTLSASPNDWTIGIRYTDGSLYSPNSVALDSQGNVWAGNGAHGLTKLSPQGKALSGTSGFVDSAHGLAPTALAVDTGDNVWAANNLTGVPSVEFSNDGSYVMAGASSSDMETDMSSVSLDGANNVFTSQMAANAVNESTASSSYKSFVYLHPGGLSDTTEIAATPMTSTSGYTLVWTANVGTAAALIDTDPGTSGIGSTQARSSSYTCGKNGPSIIAVDRRGYAWTATSASVNNVDLSHNLFVFNTSGKPVYDTTGCSGSNVDTASRGYTGGGLNQPAAIALDGNDTAWVANSAGNVSAFTEAGSAISPSTGYTAGGAFTSPSALAMDGSGNVWITDSTANTITELVGAATPVVTPLSLGIKYSKLGTRP
ncbi:MAG: hypothetical protein PW735_02925 [Acidobacteriaceae bacterium]|nr:hypothetical protein [Acidobacteriaceae bacterium]